MNEEYNNKTYRKEQNRRRIIAKELTVALLCSAATASPKAIKSSTKTKTSNSVEAILLYKLYIFAICNQNQTQTTYIYAQKTKNSCVYVS